MRSWGVSISSELTIESKWNKTSETSLSRIPPVESSTSRLCEGGSVSGAVVVLI